MYTIFSQQFLKKKKKKTNFSGKFKLKPITSYKYNFFYKNIVNIALLYIFIIFFFLTLAFQENFFSYFPVYFFKGGVDQLFLFFMSKGWVKVSSTLNKQCNAPYKTSSLGNFFTKSGGAIAPPRPMLAPPVPGVTLQKIGRAHV